jgi:hypothetical protein
MQKIAEIICYVGLSILALFTLLWMLTRGLGSVAAAVLLFINSPLPWWFASLPRQQSSPDLLICSNTDEGAGLG